MPEQMVEIQGQGRCDWLHDVVPSGSSIAVTVLLKLRAFTGEGRYIDAVERALRLVQPLLGAAPTGFAQWLSALDFGLGAPKQIAISARATKRRSCRMWCLANAGRIKWWRIEERPQTRSFHS
jgi:uncharacterized protein YyaL (SSP411 family)